MSIIESDLFSNLVGQINVRWTKSFRIKAECDIWPLLLDVNTAYFIKHLPVVCETSIQIL